MTVTPTLVRLRANRRTVALPILALILTNCSDATPGPTDAATRDATAIRPRDGWSALFTFRDPAVRTQRAAAPDGGWFLMPLHGHLLPTGRVMLHGFARNSRGDGPDKPVTLQSDATWIIDPADPRLAARADGDLPVEVSYPPTATAAEPDGLIRRDDQSDWEAGEAMLCGGHTFLSDGLLFYAGGTAFESDRDPGTPPNARNHGDLIAVGTQRSARFNPWGEAVAGARPGWSVGPSSQLGGRYYPTNTRLPDGRVVVASGYFDTEELPNPSVEVFDPAQNTWTPLVPAIRPGDDIADDDPRRYLYPSAQDYVHAFLLPRPWPAGTPAGNALERRVALMGITGRVVLLSVDGPAGLDRVFVPPGGRRPGEGTNDREWRGEGATTVLLPDGRILTMGGADVGGYGGRADLYDPRPGAPTFDAWESFPLCDAAGACASRYQGAALYLPDGRVAFVGGRRQGRTDGSGHEGEEESHVVNARATVDERSPALIDWQTRRVTFGSPWPDDLVRTQHSVTLLLPDGRLLVAGGRRIYCEPSCADEQPTLRLYSPAYLDPALAPWRPRLGTLVDASSGRPLALANRNPVVSLGSTVRVPVSTDAAPAPAASMRFALVANGSITHRFDQNLRYVTVPHAEANGGYVLSIPASGDALPPGPYMLFAIETVTTGSGQIDVPSIASLVMVRGR